MKIVMINLWHVRLKFGHKWCLVAPWTGEVDFLMISWLIKQIIGDCTSKDMSMLFYFKIK